MRSALRLSAPRAVLFLLIAWFALGSRISSAGNAEEPAGSQGPGQQSETEERLELGRSGDDQPASEDEQPEEADVEGVEGVPEDDEAGSDETRSDETRSDETGSEDALSERDRHWLEEVEWLMTEAEREVFLTIREKYRRDQFVRRFWEVRDPFPDTVRNELKDGWEFRALKARELYEDLGTLGAKVILLLGEPNRRERYSCTHFGRWLDVWVFDGGRGPIAGTFTLVFLGRGAEQRDERGMWQPVEGLSRLFGPGMGGRTSQQLAGMIQNDCARGGSALAALSQSLDLSRIGGFDRLLERPGDEWVQAFAARSTELDPDAEPLSGELWVSFPGRHQSRTVVQGLVGVPRDELGRSELGGIPIHNLVIDGEILRQGELFDRFRYRFDFPLSTLPAEGDDARLPLVVQRYLRPGEYTLILKVTDVHSKKAFRDERTIEVPRIERQLVAVGASADRPGSGDEAAAATDESVAFRTVPQALRGFDEANLAIATGDHVVKILPAPRILTVGKLRVEARATGEGITRVSFELDGRPVMRKSRPPYSVELDLGDTPQIHTVRAVALDAEGRPLASDELVVNAGPHRFAVRLVEPQQGRRYRDSLRVHAEIETPEGENLDRVEIYLNDTRLATLYQPPWEQPILLDSDELAWVRVVAVLEDGGSTEEVRFINAPDFVDQMDVQMVELFTTVVDRKGDFVEDLSREELLVREDGEEQTIRRFELVRDLPIRAGVVIDTSTSMMIKLPEVEEAAYRFLETVITPRDRAAVIVFNDEPRLAVRFTSDSAILAGGLAGLTAEGETALYDSVVYALHYFGGLQGKRAIVVLTDGEDSCSSYTYTQMLEFARRSGVAIYVIGLDIGSNQHDVRSKMQRLSSQTGGESFFIEGAWALSRVYDQIQKELRSQYLVAYQSAGAGDDGDAFRRVEIEVTRRGLEAKSIPGYYP